jgi:hypothetical protein
MQEKFALRKEYFVDYRKWCSEMCGAILEYRYLLKILEFPEIAEDKSKSYDNYLILHFWEIHSTISAGHKWVGKLYKETHVKESKQYRLLQRFITYKVLKKLDKKA